MGTSCSALRPKAQPNPEHHPGRVARDNALGVSAALRWAWLRSPGVDEREELRESAELKHSPDRERAGNHHEVDLQPGSLLCEFDDAVNAAS